MMRYFIYLSYDGTNYHGWQIQPNANSVQEELQKALSTVLRREVAVTGAGRTDTGVHARVMVAHFDYVDEGVGAQVGAVAQKGIGAQKGAVVQVGAVAQKGAGAREGTGAQEMWCKQLTYRLNRIVPRDIAVEKIVPVSDDMHARFSATQRTYHYYVHTRKSPFARHYSLLTHFQLDFDKMNEAAKYLLEVDDFASFCKVGSDAKTTICKVSLAEWVQTSETEWYFVISADRFLRNMVRAVVGTLVEVGRGRMTLQQFKDTVATRKRTAAGESMPAHALFLEDIRYT